MAFCCLCEKPVDAWLPYAKRADRSPFMILMETVGSGQRTAMPMGPSSKASGSQV